MITTTMRWAMVAAILAATSGSAGASYVNFAFLGNGISGSGAVNVVANGDGSYTAISGQMTVYGGRSGTANLYANPNGTAAAKIPDVSGSNYGYTYDDQLLLNQSTKVTYNGLLFRIGNIDYNLFYNTQIANPDYELLEFDGTSASSFVSSQTYYTGLQLLVASVQVGVAPAIVPEPSSLALCGLGVASAMVARRPGRRRAIAA